MTTHEAIDAPTIEAKASTQYALMVDYLNGRALPPLPDLPSQVHKCHDEPLAEDDLADVTNATELGLLLGVSRQRAHQLIQQRAAKAHTATEGTEP